MDIPSVDIPQDINGTPNYLEVDPAHTDCLMTGSLAMLPANEVVLVEQLDWSESKINL